MQCGRVGRRLLSEPSPGHFTVAGALCVFWGEEGEGGAEAGTAAMRLSTQDGMEGGVLRLLLVGWEMEIMGALGAI